MARALSNSSRLDVVISVMVQARRRARSGGGRFLHTLQQAELCLESARLGHALPLLDMLTQRIDDLRLEQWEHGSLCARVLSYPYPCLKGKEDTCAAAVDNRLCQINVGEALLLAVV